MEGRFGDMEFTAGTLMFVALFWLVPLIMAFLTMVLQGRVNRYANAGMGVVLTAMWVWDLVEHLASGEEFSGGPLVVVAMIVAGLTILWHAWKWPTAQEELEKPSPLLADDRMTRVSAGTTPFRVRLETRSARLAQISSLEQHNRNRYQYDGQTGEDCRVAPIHPVLQRMGVEVVAER